MQLAARAVGVDDQHAGAVVPLQLETGRAADQVHVARVVDLEAELLEAGLGVARVDVELKEEEDEEDEALRRCLWLRAKWWNAEPHPPLQPVDDDVVRLVRDVQRHQTQVGEVPEQLGKENQHVRQFLASFLLY